MIICISIHQYSFLPSFTTYHYQILPINMAESLLFSFAGSFLSKLTSCAVKQASLVLGVFNDLRYIKNTVLIIKGVLLDAEQKQHQNFAMREWLRQFRCVFHDAEDLIDDFECEAMRKQLVKTSGSFRRKVRRFLSTSSNPLAYRLKMAHEIKDIKKRLDKVVADRLNFGLQINNGGHNHVVHQRELTHSHVVDSDVIGRKKDKKIIINLLLMQDHKCILSVVPIVGIGGLGKTTLAKLVFNDKSINESFPLKMWVCVSQDCDLKHLLVKILKSATQSAPAPAPYENFKNFDMQKLKNRLRNTLNGQKFLLVLDDIWNEDHVKWDELKNLIQVGVQGCKVLVTTRSHTVAKVMGTHSPHILQGLFKKDSLLANVMDTHSPHILQGLSKKDSLSVFVKWAFKDGEKEKYPELVKIGKDIVQKCGGLPLALRTLGSSLFSKVDIQEWIFVRDNDIWKLPPNEEDILPAVKLSYDQLPSYLKPCFACFSLFEKGFEFNSVDVITFWEALGFLSLFEKGKTSRDIGNKFLLELLSRSFLQDFFDYGNAYTFTLHDIVHDLALYVADDEFQLLKSRIQDICENVLHLSFLKNDFIESVLIPTYPRWRTILFPPEATNQVLLNTLVSRCKYLRILKLNNSSYESLPDSIGELKHLRILDLEFNEELRILPNSVCKLQNLQSLKLTGCLNLEELPSGIGNLISLQHLTITTKQSNFLVKQIAKLTSLESLGFRSCHNLESLFEGIQLPSLKVFCASSCDGLKIVSLRAFPNLEYLHIENCSKLKLSMGHDNQIPKLNLKFLSFESLSELTTFPQWLQGSANILKTLRVANCDNFVEIPHWFSSFICLKTLQIVRCPKLLSLHDKDQLPNIENLGIEDCPELLKRYAPRIGHDWKKISHIKSWKSWSKAETNRWRKGQGFMH